MGKRIIRTREIRTSKPTIIGEGEETEYRYFKHLCSFTKTSAEVLSSNFGPNVLRAFERRIKAILDKNGSVVVVFDTDVTESDMAKRQWMQALKKKYRDHKDVLICDSYPCIEYWFLLHFKGEETNRKLSSSEIVDILRGPDDNNDNRKKTNKKKEKEEEKKKLIPGYCKNGPWVKKDKWVKDLRKDGKEQIACQNAYKYREGGALYEKGRSYTNIYKFFERYLPELLEEYLLKK